MRAGQTKVGAGIMAAISYAIQLTERTQASPGTSEELSLLILHDDKPVGAVTFEWHGDLELKLSSSKFFGGKSPGIDNAWQLAELVRRAVEAEHRDGITGAADSFASKDGEEVIWEVSLEPAAGSLDRSGQRNG